MKVPSRLIVLRFAAIRLKNLLWIGPYESAQYPDSSKSERFTVSCAYWRPVDDRIRYRL